MLLPFGGKVPRDEGAVFVAPNATVLGDVVLGPGSSVWYGAVLRGDDGTLTLGENTNVQDNAVLHCDPGGAVTLGKNVTVGHCALVHGCTVGDGSLIGMHATLLNHCVVGKTASSGPVRWCRKARSSRTIPLWWGCRGRSSSGSAPNRQPPALPMPPTMWGRAAVTPQPCGKRKKVKTSERNNFVRSLTEFSQDFTRK